MSVVEPRGGGGGQWEDIKLAMEDTLDYWQVRRAVKEEIIKPRYRPEHLEADVAAMMERSGLATRIRNAALTFKERLDISSLTPGGRSQSSEDAAQAPTLQAEQEMLDALQSTRQSWLQFVVDGLNEISVKSTQPLASKERSIPHGSAPELVAELEVEPALGVTGAVKIHAYTAADLLQAIEGMRPNRRTVGNKAGGKRQGGGGRPSPPGWGIVQAEFSTPSLDWLRVHYRELSLSTRQVGLDDTLHAWFATEQHQVGRRAAQGGSIPVCRQFARTGVPSSVRGLVWRVALGLSEITDKDRLYYDRLCQEVLRRQLLIDGMVCADVSALGDSEHYFVFEEILRATMLALSRDTAVGPACSLPPFPRLRGMGRQSRSHGAYPPSGVVPFERMCYYAAPLAYVYAKPEELYLVFRALYTRHLCRLHALSPEGAPAPALPVLCKTFEDTLQRLDPEVVFHLVDMGLPPLRVAHPWMVQGFVGVLDVDQVLLLWDRVVGFDSLLPVALMAAAAIAFRRDALLECGSEDEVREVLTDLSQLRVVPLLQDLLFGPDRPGGANLAG